MYVYMYVYTYIYIFVLTLYETLNYILYVYFITCSQNAKRLVLIDAPLMDHLQGSNYNLRHEYLLNSIVTLVNQIYSYFFLNIEISKN